MEKEKKNTGLKIVLIIFITISLILGGYITYDKILSKNNILEINNNLEEDTIKVNEKYQGLYAFKIKDESIYALLNNTDEKLIVNYKDEVCGNDYCGTIEYEYIDSILYLYVIGEQDSTYNVNKKEYISIYSIDLTKEDTILKKEYDIDKEDRYVTNVRQTADSVYYMSYKWDNDLNCYVSKIFKFNKVSKEIQEIYDFKGNASTGQYGVFVINNKKLFVVYDISYGSESDGSQKILSINLDNNETTIVQEDISLSYYDSVSKKIISSINDNDKENSTLKVLDLNDLSSKSITTKSINNRFYSIDDILVYYEYNTNTIKIIGKNNYSIDLTKYISGTIKTRYTRLELSDNHSIIVFVYLENSSEPQKYKIKLETGEVSQTEFSNDESLSQYIYIK